jgi:PAS domain S-box-containing protein
VAGLDVTQRRRAEEALRENEAVLRSFFDSAGVIRGIVDIVEGGIVHVACNAAAAEMFGIDRDSIAGKTAEQAGASEEVARQWVALYEKSRLTGQPVSMEYSRRDAAGRDRWMLATANYLGTGPSGHPRFAYTALDLTARKRVEEALRESEERLRLAQNSGGVGVWEWNPRTETLHLTPEFEQLYGLAPGTLKTNQDWRRLVHPDDLAEVEAKRDAAVAKHEPFEMEFRILHASGEIRWLSGKGGAIYDDAGDPMRVFGVNIDITVRKLAEERLRQSESHLRNLGDNLPQGAIYQYRVDAAGRHHVDFISAGIERLTGVPAAEFVEDVEAVFRHIVPEDRDKLQAEIARSREGLTRFEAEVRHIQSLTGELRWSLLRSTPSRLPDGSTVWDGIELDITERKRAEQALRESEERFRIMADGCPTMIWVTGAGGEQRFVNRTYQEFFGVTFEQLEESGWQPLVHPDDAPAYVEAAQRAVRERAPFRAEARVRNGQGEWRWVASHAEPRWSAGGEFLGHVGITLDITESRQAEEAVRNSRKQLQDIIDGSPGVVFVKDLEGRFITANQAFERFLGMTREELRGKTDYDIMTRERADRYRENDRRVAETGEPIQIEEVADLADGRQHVFLANKFPLRDASGKIYAVCAISTDITAMKQAEERLRQSQKLESLGLLAGGVAHDFNNLLVGVIGNASLAQEMLPPGDPAAELIEAVVKTGEQAAHLTRQMLAYSGKGKFVVEALDLSALIPEISALVRPSISKKIALHFDMAPGLPLTEADRGQVQQVFMNLVLNAAEAIGSQDGLISIRTGVENVDQRYSHLHPETAELRPGRYVFLEVRDSGCGMDEATRAKIFDPFFSTKFTGRGLGLAAVSGILRGHQGAIVVSSAPGQGSCFTVLFPAGARAARQPKPALVDAALQGAGVILVVDDEPLVRQMAKTALERHGYTVLVAESGPVAIDVFRRYPGQIALVVLDLSMPQMSGEETLPELNKIRPGVKVVVSSGYSETEAMNLFRGQRVAGFIQKPYNSKGLAEKVKVYLG